MQAAKRWMLAGLLGSSMLGAPTLATAVWLALFLSTSAGATIIDMGVFTRDTTSGFDWLDVTETQGLSYDEVVAGPLYSATPLGLPKRCPRALAW